MQTTIETEVTRQIWQHWRYNSVKPKLTWIELHKLILYTSQQCLRAEVDPQEIDLLSLIDASLNYYENLNALDVQLRQLGDNAIMGTLDAGTEKLREKLLVLRTSYKHLKKRLDKTKRQNARLKAKLHKPKKKRKRRKTLK